MTYEMGTRCGGIALNLLRIVSGLLFMQHGLQKLFGLLGGTRVEQVVSLPGVAGYLEFFGGLAIVFGIFTRPVAFLLSGQMAVAYFMVHAPQALWPVVNKGELAALYCFIFLYLAFVGGGDFSIDGLRKRRAERPQ
jgi:putative oxidoreductase